MHRSRLLFSFSLFNLLAVFICVLCLPHLVPLKFNNALVVTEMVGRWYNIIIPVIQVIACGIILLIDIKDQSELSHFYRYIVAYVAVSIATYYTWVILCIQFGGFVAGDIITLPVSAMVLLLFALFMIAYGYYQYHKNIKTKSIFGFNWVKENPTIWRKTHKLAGVMCIVTGSIIMILSILNELVFKTNWIYLVSFLVLLILYYLTTLFYSIKQKRLY